MSEWDVKQADDILVVLENELDELNKEQTPMAEFQKAMIHFEIDELKASIKTAISKRARLFLSVWGKVGSFEAIRQDGTRRRSSIDFGGSGVQNVWNAIAEAKNLAIWSYNLKSKID